MLTAPDPPALARSLHFWSAYGIQTAGAGALFALVECLRHPNRRRWRSLCTPGVLTTPKPPAIARSLHSWSAYGARFAGADMLFALLECLRYPIRRRWRSLCTPGVLTTPKPPALALSLHSWSAYGIRFAGADVLFALLECLQRPPPAPPRTTQIRGCPKSKLWNSSSYKIG